MTSSRSSSRVASRRRVPEQLHAELGAALLGHLVEVQLGGRVTGVEPLIDAVEAGGERHGRAQVRVAEPSTVRSSIRPAAGMRSIWVRLLKP